MYSRQHRTSKTNSNNSDAPASNQFAPRPFVVQPQVAEPTTQQNQTDKLQAKGEKTKEVSDGFPDPSVFTRHIAPPRVPRIQMKLSGKPGKYEREADSMAERVMSIDAPTTNPQTIQRKEDENSKIAWELMKSGNGLATSIYLRKIALTDKDWNAFDRHTWKSNIGKLANTKNTFVKAAIFNTKNHHPEEYATIEERSDYYGVIDSLAQEGGAGLPKGVRFFGAASQVTNEYGVGAIEGVVGGALHSQEAIKILQEVNKILLDSNMRVISNLMSRGKPTDPLNPASIDEISPLMFDLKMVSLEQGTVENYLQTELDKIPKDKKNQAIKDINDDLNFKGFWRTIAEHTVASTQPIEWAKKALGASTLNFMIRTHREAIGKALIFSLHNFTQEQYTNYIKSGIVPGSATATGKAVTPK
ncbi:hypothetical protein NIES4074_65790 (plasmid) [Cylindrospermum sp. NIES-4074]|nr:hypothetical protein NIES4074_65790 [Cylindrospermum sp. NIES-4074]